MELLSGRWRPRLYGGVAALLRVVALGACVACSPYAWAVSGGLSEEEQLDLLERADKYCYSPGSSSREAIRLYEEVLEKVDLAPPIRLDIQFRIANMHLFLLTKDTGGKPDLLGALERYQAIVRDYPKNEVIVFQSSGYIADCYSLLNRRPEAEKQYLSVRRFARAVPESDAPRYGPYLKGWRDGAMRNVIGLYDWEGEIGIANLQRVARENPDDTELCAEIEKTISRMKEKSIKEAANALTEDLTAQNVAMPDSSPANANGSASSDDEVTPAAPTVSETVPVASPRENRMAYYGYGGALALLLAIGGLFYLRSRDRKKA